MSTEKIQCTASARMW